MLIVYVLVLMTSSYTDDGKTTTLNYSYNDVMDVYSTLESGIEALKDIRNKFRKEDDYEKSCIKEWFSIDLDGDGGSYEIRKLEADHINMYEYDLYKKEVKS